jgi:hypothetical protein
MKKLHYILLLALVSFISCKKEKDVLQNEKGDLTFSFNDQINQATGAKSLLLADSIYAAVVSIEDEQGVIKYDKKVIELFNMNGHYISTPISLSTGNYKLTDFLLTDKNKKVLYACPKKGSKNAYLVKEPLDISFSIKKDEVTELVPEVIKAGNPADFGYTDFGFNIVTPVNFWFKTYGTTELEWAYSVSKTRNGGYIICGNYYSFNTSVRRVIVIRTDCNGNKIWEKNYLDCIEASVIKTLDNGNFIIFGTTKDYKL